MQDSKETSPPTSSEQADALIQKMEQEDMEEFLYQAVDFMMQLGAEIGEQHGKDTKDRFLGILIGSLTEASVKETDKERARAMIEGVLREASNYLGIEIHLVDARDLLQNVPTQGNA